MKRRIIVVLICFLASYGTMTSVLAAQIKEKCKHGHRTFNDKHLVSGVGNYGKSTRYYWIDTKFGKNYTECIKDAFSFWTHTTSNPGVTTPISIHRSTKKSDATFEIRRKSFGSNTTGLTEYYSYSSSVGNPSAKNWTWNICYINESLTKDYSNAKKIGLAEHELGHAMGLSHQPFRPTDSLMYNYDDERKFPNGKYRNRPSERDCKNINHIY